MNMPNELPRSYYLLPQISAKKPQQFPIKVKLNFRGIFKKLKKLKKWKNKSCSPFFDKRVHGKMVKIKKRPNGAKMQWDYR